MDLHTTPSTQPYLIRALYDWCVDHGFTPYLLVVADQTVQVPREFVKNGEIVLNISMSATSHLKLDNDFISFKARFGGKSCEIMVPVNRVAAIYARENGQGMEFPRPAPDDPVPEGGKPGIEPLSARPVLTPVLSTVPPSAPEDDGEEPPPAGSPGPGAAKSRPVFKVVK